MIVAPRVRFVGATLTAPAPTGARCCLCAHCQAKCWAPPDAESVRCEECHAGNVEDGLRHFEAAE